MKALDAALGALATHRITKLLVDDEITADLRWWADQTLDKYEGSPVAEKIRYLINCPWCVSVYVGIVIALIESEDDLKKSITRGLAYSSVTGMLFNKV